MPPLAEALRPARSVSGTPLQTRLNDPVVGPIDIRAALDDVPTSESLVVIVHGIGGTADSHYCVSAARAAVAAGCSAIRISLRGADGNGDDIYHAGLTEDLNTLLACPLLRRYRRVFLLGYSLGGNIALRAAIDQIDPRLAGVVAICPPLDLRAAMENFDRRRFLVWGFSISTVMVYHSTFAAMAWTGRGTDPLGAASAPELKQTGSSVRPDRIRGGNHSRRADLTEVDALT